MVTPLIIHSSANPIFKKLMALHTARGIRRHGEFLVAGPKIVGEALQQQRDSVTAWIAPPDLPPPPAELKHARRVLLTKELFRKVNLFGAPGPLIALRLKDLPAFEPQAPWPAGCTLFIPFGDPDNVGAAIRAAAGLGAARVVLLQEAACPFLPKAVRASAGAIWKISLESGPGLSELAGIRASTLFALDLPGKEGESLNNVKPPESYGLVAGMEGQGLPEALRKNWRRVYIPLAKGVESLNAAAAVAITLWAWR